MEINSNEKNKQVPKRIHRCTANRIESKDTHRHQACKSPLKNGTVTKPASTFVYVCHFYTRSNVTFCIRVHNARCKLFSAIWMRLLLCDVHGMWREYLASLMPSMLSISVHLFVLLNVTRHCCTRQAFDVCPKTWGKLCCQQLFNRSIRFAAVSLSISSDIHCNCVFHSFKAIKMQTIHWLSQANWYLRRTPTDMMIVAWEHRIQCETASPQKQHTHTFFT